MSKRNRRKGFDYFIDKYELSYLDDGDNEYFDDEEEYYPHQSSYYDRPRYNTPVDRFAKTNKYTGDVAGKNYYFENSIYEHPMNNRGFHNPNMNNSMMQNSQKYNNQQGTIEFSAVPGQGGLNPNKRPLGDETMMFTNVGSVSTTPPSLKTTNPHLLKLLETQQLQLTQSQIYQNEIDKKMDNINSQMNSISEKLDDVSKSINLNNINNTSTLSFKNNQTETQTNSILNSSQSLNNLQQQSNTNTINNELLKSQEINLLNDINKINDSTLELNAQVNNANSEVVKKKKMSKLAIAGIVIWVLIIIGLIIVSLLLYLGVIKF